MHVATLLDRNREIVCTFQCRTRYASLLRCLQVFLTLERIHDPEFKTSTLNLFEQRENVLEALSIINTQVAITDVAAFFKRQHYAVEFREEEDAEEEICADREIEFLRIKLEDAQSDLREELYNHLEPKRVKTAAEKEADDVETQ